MSEQTNPLANLPSLDQIDGALARLRQKQQTPPRKELALESPPEMFGFEAAPSGPSTPEPEKTKPAAQQSGNPLGGLQSLDQIDRALDTYRKQKALEPPPQRTFPAPSGLGYPQPVVPGNIQWYGRQRIAPPADKTQWERLNIPPDTQYGTVHSVSKGEDGLEVLVPSIWDGQWHTEDQAWEHYKKTGQHMGKFRSPEEADKYAQQYSLDAGAGKFDVPPATDWTRPQVHEAIVSAAQNEGVPEQLALAVAKQESGLNPYTPPSSAGAIGVMQLMPATAAGLGVDPHDPAQNIAGGVKYLRQLHDQFGDWRTALMAYNWGPPRVQAWIDRGEQGAIPQETANYVDSIQAMVAAAPATAAQETPPEEPAAPQAPTAPTKQAANFDEFDQQLMDIRRKTPGLKDYTVASRAARSTDVTTPGFWPGYAETSEKMREFGGRMAEKIAKYVTPTDQTIRNTVMGIKSPLALSILYPGFTGKQTYWNPTPQEMEKMRQEMTLGGQLGTHAVQGMAKIGGEFIADPINMTFLAMTGPLGAAADFPAAMQALDAVFYTQMAYGAGKGAYDSYQRYKQLNGDVWATTDANGNLQWKPGQAEFWESLGDTALDTLFLAHGVTSIPDRVALIKAWGEFNDVAVQKYGKEWQFLTTEQKRRTLVDVQRRHVGETRKLGWEPPQVWPEIRGPRRTEAGAYKAYAVHARSLGLKPKVDQGLLAYLGWARSLGLKSEPKDFADAERQYAEATAEIREAARKKAAFQEMLRNLDEQIANAPEKTRRPNDLEPPPIVGGAGYTPRTIRIRVPYTEAPAPEPIVAPPEWVEPELLARGIKLAAELGGRVTVANLQQELKIPADAANTLLKRLQNEGHAERLAGQGPEGVTTTFAGESPWVIGRTVRGPGYEKEVTVWEPNVAHGVGDFAAMTPEDREWARYKMRERQARITLEQERQRRVAEDRERDLEERRAADRVAEARERAREKALKIAERRRFRFREEPDAQIMDIIARIDEQMTNVANSNMFATPEEFLKYLNRPNRDRPHTPEEQDFLRMAEEKQMMQPYADPRNLPPIFEAAKAPMPPGPPRVDVMRERLATVTNEDQAQRVLDGADNDQLVELMHPFNQRATAQGMPLYAHGGERSLFDDDRGTHREGMAWEPLQGVTVVSEMPVHPEDLPRWATPGSNGKFVLQVVREGSGNFGAEGYKEPYIVIGNVDPNAERQQWDWTDWAAGEMHRRNEAFLDDLDSVDRQHDLQDAANALDEQAAHAPTPEQADQLAKDAEEARTRADELAKQRQVKQGNEEVERAEKERYPVGAWIPEVARGNTITIVPPGGRIKLEGHYALVLLDDVISSHLPLENFEINPDYVWFTKDYSPLQPWHYESEENRRSTVVYRSKNPELNTIYNTTPTGVDGPPILRQDGITISGNGRTFIQELMYRDGRGQEIVDKIEQTKGSFGLGDTVVPGVSKKPIVAIIVDSPVLEGKRELQDIGEDFNRPPQTGASTAETAALLGGRFDQDFKDWIVTAFDAMDDSATLRSFMERYSEDIVKRMEANNWYSPHQKATWVDSNGKLTKDAKNAFEKGVRGLVIRDANALQILERPGMLGFAQVLDRAMPALLRMRAKGGRWDISDYLTNAIHYRERILDLENTLRTRLRMAAQLGQKDATSVDAYLHPEKLRGEQQTLAGEVGAVAPERPKNVDLITEALMRAMELTSTELKKAFNGYSLDAEGKQAGFFAPPAPWESFTNHIGSLFKNSVLPEGVVLTEDDWGRLERRVEEKPTPSEMPPKIEEAPPAEAPPEVPAEAPGMNEAKFRQILAEHPGISPTQRETMIDVWRMWAERYLQEPLDRFLDRVLAGVEVGGEFRAGPGLEQPPTEPTAEGRQRIIRGRTRFVEDGKAIIQLFDMANFATFAHESIHAVRPYLKPEDLAILERNAGVEEGVWTRDAEEKVANWWERYLRDGTAPNEELRTLFAKLKAWMLAIYDKIKGTELEKPVPNEVRRVFDRMLTGEPGPKPIERPPTEGRPSAITAPPAVEKPVEAVERPSLEAPPAVADVSHTALSEAEARLVAATQKANKGKSIEDWKEQLRISDEVALLYEEALKHGDPRNLRREYPNLAGAYKDLQDDRAEMAERAEAVEEYEFPLGHPHADPSRYPPAAEVPENRYAGATDAEAVKHLTGRVKGKDRIRAVLEATRKQLEQQIAKYKGALERGNAANLAGLYGSLGGYKRDVRVLEDALGIPHAPLPDPPPAPVPEYHSLYNYEINTEIPPESAFRVPVPGEPTVADLIKPGDIIATNYGQLVHVVDSVSPHEDFGHTSYGVSMHRYGEKPRKGQFAGINELVATGGKITKLLKANTDEVFKISEADAKRITAGEIEPSQATPLPLVEAAPLAPPPPGEKLASGGAPVETLGEPVQTGMFNSPEAATDWVLENADSLKGASLFETPQGEGAVQYVPREEAPPAEPPPRPLEEAPAEQPRLIEKQDLRDLLPEGVRVYASGANRISDIRGFVKAGVPIGVSMRKLGRDVVTVLRGLAGKGIPVFVDSGAFSEVKAGPEGIEVVDPITDQEWTNILSNYANLSRFLGKDLTVVAPDRIGDQKMTLERIRKYRDRMLFVHQNGSKIVLPIQAGEMSPAAFFARAEAEIGGGNIRLIPAFPMNKAAADPEAIATFLRQIKPQEIHLLGIGASNARADTLVRYLKDIDPNLRISMDAVATRAKVGEGRPVTKAERGYRLSMMEGISGEIDLREHGGPVLDYTEMIYRPSEWADEKFLRRIAAGLYLSKKETEKFVADPDKWVAENENDYVTGILNTAYQNFVADQVAAPARTAAIAETFAEGKIGRQIEPPPGRSHAEMTWEEFSETPRALTAPKNSILNIKPEDYRPEVLGQRSKVELEALAEALGTSKSGSKDGLVERIIRRRQFREDLGKESLESLMAKKADQLKAMAKEAGIYSGLPKKELSESLLKWLQDAKTKTRDRIVSGNHIAIVINAAKKGLPVSEENLRRYSLNPDGTPAVVVGMKRLIDIERENPELLAAARGMSQEQFADWLDRNPDQQTAVSFIEPGMGGRYAGGGFWTTIHQLDKGKPGAGTYGPQPALALLGEEAPEAAAPTIEPPPGAEPPREAVATEDLEAIRQAIGEILGAPAEELPEAEEPERRTMEVDPKRLEYGTGDLGKLYSSDTIAEKVSRIRGITTIDGIKYTGIGGDRLVRVYTPEEWGDRPTTTYGEKVNSDRPLWMDGYLGIKVTHKGKPYILGGRADEIQMVAAATPEAPRELFQITPETQAEYRKRIHKKYRDFLTEDELDDLTKTRKVGASFMEIIRRLPTVREWVAAARAGEVGRQWYAKTSAAFDVLSEVAPDVFPAEDKQRWVDFVAAISPQQDVKLNLLMALEHWKKWIDAGRPLHESTLRQLFKTMDLPARVPNAARAIMGENLSGFKVTNFGQAMYGEHGPVVNDTWKAFFAGIPAKKLTQAKFYHAVTVRARQVADRLGWTPEEASAAIWSFTKTLSEATGRETNYDPVETVEKLTDEQIVKHAADMSVLLRDPEVQDRLRALDVNTNALNQGLDALQRRFAAVRPQEPGGIETADPRVLRSIARRFRKAGVGEPELFQADTPTGRDVQINFIRSELKRNPTPERRRILELGLARLTGGEPPRLEAPPARAAEAPPPERPPVETAKAEPPRVEKKTVKPETVKIWTPKGEIEVEVPAKQGGISRGPEPPRRADEGRKAVDGVDRDKDVERSHGVPVEPGQQPGRGGDRPTGQRVPTSGGERPGRGGRGTPRTTVQDVPATRIDAPKRERGAPLYDEAEWKERADLYGLPKGVPVPTVRLDDYWRRRLLENTGQTEVVESMLSGLAQHDSFVLATTTGTGKTYMAAAALAQLKQRQKMNQVLVLTTNQTLVKEFIDRLIDFDVVEAQAIPEGMNVPEEPGVYVTTYATALNRTGTEGRPGIDTHPWDFLIADEIAAARNWTQSQQGQMMKKMAGNAKQVLYMSATPFHTALELGHMDKLGLWDKEGFDAWSRQFGVYRDADGQYGGGNAPKKLVKLRQQMIERGQMINIDRNMDGYHPSFLLAPLTEADKAGFKRIQQAFDLAKAYYARQQRRGPIRALQANMSVYMKSYLERARLPQAIELGKRLEKEGYKVIFFSEHRKARDEIFSLMEEPNEALGGEIDQLLPKIPDVVETLQAAFPNQMANFSGKHSAMRTGEKDAFNTNEKKHIFATYGAGGVGVSLHDRSGKRPRAAIYLGPPYSGVMLDQAIGRPWRYETKSDVQAYFLISDARAEVDLVIKKVAPRLESLRAVVSGVDMTDPMTVAMRDLESAQEGALAYDLGQEHKPDADKMSSTYDRVPIMNYKQANVPPAREMMDKGMKYPGGPSRRGPSQVFQAEEYEPSKEELGLTEDLPLPEESEAKVINEEAAKDFAAGRGAPGITPEELNSIKPTERQTLAEQGRVVAEAAAEREDNEENPKAAVRQSLTNNAKWAKAVKQSVSESRVASAARVSDLTWLTSGRTAIIQYAKKAGAVAVGRDLVRDIRRYNQETGNIAGPFQRRYYDIINKYKLSKAEHDNMFLVKEGATRRIDENDLKSPKVPVAPLNDRVSAAVAAVTKLLQDAKDLLAKEGVWTEVYDKNTGRPVKIPFSEQMDDPKFMPHRYDYRQKITLVDPETGEKYETTLRDMLKPREELGEARYESIVRSLMKRHGSSRAEVEDWLNRRTRDVPLMGNIERAREVGLPYYRTDADVMIGYFEGMGEVIARKRIFGQEREKQYRKVLNIPDVRARTAINEIFDSLLSRRHWDPDTHALVSLAADWEVLSKMTFSAVKIPFHAMHLMLATDARTLLGAIGAFSRHPRDMWRWASDIGATSEQMRANFRAELGLERRWSQWLLDKNQFHNAYTFDRALVAAGGRVVLDRALPKLIKGKLSDRMRRELRDTLLLDDGQINEAIENQRWTEADYARAGKALSDYVMFTSDPTEIPTGWRARAPEHPAADSVLAFARILTLLRSFSFKTAKLMKERLLDELIVHHNPRPWIPFLIFYPLGGEMMRQLGSLMHLSTKQADWWTDPKNRDAKHLIERFVEDIGFTVGLTEVTMLAAAANGGYLMQDAAEDIFGPFYSDILRTGLRLPYDLLHAKTTYQAYMAIKRWTTGLFPAASGPVKLGEKAVGYDPAKAKKQSEREVRRMSPRKGHSAPERHYNPL